VLFQHVGWNEIVLSCFDCQLAKESEYAANSEKAQATDRGVKGDQLFFERMKGAFCRKKPAKGGRFESAGIVLVLLSEGDSQKVSPRPFFSNWPFFSTRQAALTP
jgi:hypothetical protein